LVVGMNYRAAFATSTWNWMSVACVVASFLTYVLFLGVYCSTKINPPMYGVALKIAAEPIFWFGMLIVPTLAMVLDIFKTFLQLEFMPDDADMVQETAAMSQNRDPRTSLRSTPTPANDRSNPVDIPTSLDESMGPARSMRGFSDSSMSIHAHSSFAFDHPEDTPRPLRSLFRQTMKRNRDVSNYRAPRRRDQSRIISSVNSCCRFLSPESRFAQQDLWSVQLQRDWRLTLLAMLVGGTVLVLVGLITFILSQGCYRIDIHYDGPVQSQFVAPDMEFHCPCPTRSGIMKSCDCHITIPQNMEPPISVFYVLKPFYQSYQTYLTSVVYTELEGEEAPSSERQSSCTKPTRLDSAGNEIVPCGLQATSVFNDTFEVMGMDIDTSSLNDYSSQFKNPSDYPDRANTSWLYERYPTVTSKEDGVRNPHFAVWMRPSALARLSKPYGTINSRLNKGQDITIRINASFPVESLDADKRIALASKSVLGGSNVLLYRFCFYSGMLCYVLAVCVIAIRYFCPRLPGQKRDCLRAGNQDELPAPAASSTHSESGSSRESIVAPLMHSPRAE